MSKKFTYSLLVASIVAALSGCSLDGDDGAQGATGPAGPAGTDGANGSNGTDGKDGADGAGVGSLTRLATVPTGAEVTGLFLSEEGDLFFNVQHPSDANDEVDSFNQKPINKGTVGVLAGLNANLLPANLVESPVPASDKEKETVISAYGQYQILGQAGDTYAGKLANGLGNIYNLQGDQAVVLSQNPDFNGFIQTAAGEGYLFSNWENIPGGVSRLKIKKNDSGSWEVLDAMMVDFSQVKGTAANCFGSVTPWGTPLTSEEWIVSSKVDTTTQPVFDGDVNTQSGMEMLTGADTPNAYRYGYIAEITNPTSDNPTPVKHYALGRYEHENATVMPDGKTVYLSQDDTGGVMFKFVADTANDLSVGTLYGAKLTQDTGSDEPQTTGFDVNWVELGHASNSDIEAWIAEYDAVSEADYVDGTGGYMTMKDVEAWASGAATYPTVAEGGSPVTAGQPMDNRAVFIESRQAARLKGATAEWRKLEGISINTKRAREAVEGVESIANEDVTSAYVYIGIADLDKTMIDGEGDIQLSSRVKDCGGVYRMKLLDGYDVNRIEPVIMGSTYRDSLTGAARCDVNQLSQPDNVIVMDDGRIIVGEDGFQDNNTLWIYRPVK